MHKGPYHKRYKPVGDVTICRHPLYVMWNNIFQRCENPTAPGYKEYGGRGIHVTKRWYKFENFLIDMGPRPSCKHSIDRIKNDKGYGKSNCRWATRSQQMLNRRKFKNCKTDSRGVVERRNGYIAKMDYEKHRYIIGYFDTEAQAAAARNKFERLFLKDRAAAIAMLPNNAARRNSSTGERGITPHKDGGYTARVTINGRRQYLGYFETLEDAINERSRAIENNDRILGKGTG